MSEQYQQLYQKHRLAIDDLISGSITSPQQNQDQKQHNNSELADKSNTKTTNVKSQTLFFDDFKNLDSKEKIAFLNFCLKENINSNNRFKDQLKNTPLTQEEFALELKKQIDEYDESFIAQKRRIAGQFQDFNQKEIKEDKEFDNADNLINRKYLKKIFKRIRKYFDLKAYDLKAGDSKILEFEENNDPKTRESLRTKIESQNDVKPFKDSTISQNNPSNQDQQTSTIQTNQSDYELDKLNPQKLPKNIEEEKTLLPKQTNFDSIGLEDIDILLSNIEKASFIELSAKESANLKMKEQDFKSELKDDKARSKDDKTESEKKTYSDQQPISSVKNSVANYHQSQVGDAFKTLKLQSFNAGNPPRRKKQSTDILKGSDNEPETLLNLRKKHINHLQDFWTKIQDYQPSLDSPQQNSSFSNDLKEQFFEYAQNSYGANLKEHSLATQSSETTSQKLANYQKSINSLLTDKTKTSGNIQSTQNSISSDSKQSFNPPKINASNTSESIALELQNIAIALHPEKQHNKSQNPQESPAILTIKSLPEKSSVAEFSMKQTKPELYLSSQVLKLSDVDFSITETLPSEKKFPEISPNNNSLARGSITLQKNSQNSSPPSIIDLSDITLSLKQQPAQDRQILANKRAQEKNPNTSKNDHSR